MHTFSLVSNDVLLEIVLLTLEVSPVELAGSGIDHDYSGMMPVQKCNATFCKALDICISGIVDILVMCIEQLLAWHVTKLTYASYIHMQGFAAGSKKHASWGGSSCSPDA